MAAAMFFLKYLTQGTAQRFRGLAQDSRGVALLESVMAITIFAALGTALMVGIRTANISGAVVEDHSIAEQLARNQMEYVFTQPYLAPPSAYPSILNSTDVTYTVDPGFTVTADALVWAEGNPAIVTDTNIEKVVVTVSDASRDILVLETLRTND
jgi:hypothetical protein